MSFFLIATSLFSFLLLIVLAGVVLGTPLFIILATMFEGIAQEKNTRNQIPIEESEIGGKTLHSMKNQPLNPHKEIKSTLLPSHISK